MQEGIVPFQRIVFVCVNERDASLGVSCGPRNGAEIHRLLKEGVKALGKAAKGPNIMVFPDNWWFYDVSEEDVPAILEKITSGL